MAIEVKAVLPKDIQRLYLQQIADHRDTLEELNLMRAEKPDDPLWEETISNITNRVSEGQDAINKLRNIVVEHNLGLVDTHLLFYPPSSNGSSDRKDYFQIGVTGLMEAVKRFDPTKDVQLSTYAESWIMQAINRDAANNSRIIRFPEHLIASLSEYYRTYTQLTQWLGRKPTPAEIEELGGIKVKPNLEDALQAQKISSLDSPITIGGGGEATLADFIATKEPTPEQLALTNDFRQQLNSILTPIEVDGMILRIVHNESFKDIGKILKMSKQGAQQMVAKALERARKRLPPDYCPAGREY